MIGLKIKRQFFGATSWNDFYFSVESIFQESLEIFQERLDYFFISNVSQESVKNPDVLAAFLTDHSPIMFSLFSKSEGKRVKGYWNIITLYVRKVDRSIAWINNIYLRKPREWKYYWWAECMGILKIRNKKLFWKIF